MIYYVSLQHHQTPYLSYHANVGQQIPDLRYISYEQLFHDRRAPYGHYIFTDLDRLTHYEREVVIGIADALCGVDSAPRILNDPRDTLDRYPLLRMLERQGINRFTAIRLDDGGRPDAYPVFIRSEDSHHGADTDLLHSEEEFEQAIADLRTQGKVLKRRIAIGYRAAADQDGFYRKYSVHNIDGQLVPHHIIRRDHWLVRGRSEFTKGEEHARAELDFIRQNPHADVLGRVFRLAHIDFGRVDYGIVDGEVQVYEINTNPHFQGVRKGGSDSSPARAQRKQITQQRLIDATNAFNVPLPRRPAVGFSLPSPIHHQMRPWQRGRLSVTRYQRWLKSHPGVRRFVPGRFW